LFTFPAWAIAWRLRQTRDAALADAWGSYNLISELGADLVWDQRREYDSSEGREELLRRKPRRRKFDGGVNLPAIVSDPQVH
jgi:hypothetical protein